MATESGAAGDIDADGKDEIVIMRDNNIRYYPNAHNSTGSVDFGTTTNKRAIAIGDLDRNGFVAGAQFVANPNQIPVTVEWGYSFSGSFTLQNGATNDPISFAASIEGNPFGLTVQPTSNIAPGVNGGTTTINYTIDGAKLAPNQVYPYVVRIDNTSGLPVLNTPYRIPITATVKTPELKTIPDNTMVLIYPCQEPLTEQELTLQVRGVIGSELMNITVQSAAQVASAADNQSAVTAQPEQSLAVEGITAGTPDHFHQRALDHIHECANDDDSHDVDAHHQPDSTDKGYRPGLLDVESGTVRLRQCHRSVEIPDADPTVLCQFGRLAARHSEIAGRQRRS